MSTVTSRKIRLFHSRVSYCRDVLGDKPVAVKLQGVEYMNDDPSEVDVLYARVIPADGSDSLQRLADGLENKFKERGLMRYNFEHVKLHATVMNTKLRDDPEGTDCSEAKKSRSEVPARKPFRIPFDARQLVEVRGCVSVYVCLF